MTANIGVTPRTKATSFPVKMSKAESSSSTAQGKMIVPPSGPGVDAMKKITPSQWAKAHSGPSSFADLPQQTKKMRSKSKRA